MNKTVRSFLTICCSLAILCPLSVDASNLNYDSISPSSTDMEGAYKAVMNYAENSGIEVDMSLDEFIKAYEAEEYTSIEEYANAYYNILTTNENPRMMFWQYGTGKTLPKPANYSRYNLLNVVKKGDILYEPLAGFGIPAHTAIVEGVFYSAEHQQYYIRVVEAIQRGVVVSVLDDDRISFYKGKIYRVKNTTPEQCNAALAFAESQVGKKYALDFQKDLDPDQPDWYCSELVWAAYMHQGFDLETKGFNEPGITPRDIVRGSAVEQINIAK